MVGYRWINQSSIEYWFILVKNRQNLFNMTHLCKFAWKDDNFESLTGVCRREVTMNGTEKFERELKKNVNEKEEVDFDFDEPKETQ